MQQPRRLLTDKSTARAFVHTHGCYRPLLLLLLFSSQLRQFRPCDSHASTVWRYLG
jgi:hypothetical protein